MRSRNSHFDSVCIKSTGSYVLQCFGQPPRMASWAPGEMTVLSAFSVVCAAWAANGGIPETQHSFFTAGGTADFNQQRGLGPWTPGLTYGCFCSANQGSLAISFQVRHSVRPMHLFGHTFDHDYYFRLPS